MTVWHKRMIYGYLKEEIIEEDVLLMNGKNRNIWKVLVEG